MIFSNKVIVLNRFNPALINYINDIVKNNKFSNIIIVLDNTFNLSTSFLKELNKTNRLKFRITGPYNDKRLNKKKKKEINRIYEEITYTIEELINIISYFELLESHKLIKNYTSFNFIVDTYLTFREYFKTTSLNETKKDSSLKCILTKNPSAEGISMLLEEYFIRNNEMVSFAEGKYSNGEINPNHYWNVAEINEKFIAFDLYLEILAYRDGYRGLPLYFGEIVSFVETHIPADTENIQYYSNSLTAINNQMLLDSYDTIKNNKIIENVAEVITREDGSQYIYSFLSFDNENLYKIMYYDYIDNKASNPRIYYFEYDGEFNDQLYDILTKKLLTIDSINGSGYIGSITSDTSSFTKKENISHLIINQNKLVTRNDGSSFLIEKVMEKEDNVLSFTNKYIIYELVNKNNQYYVVESTIFTQRDLFENETDELKNKYLSRSNIEKCISENYSYLGYFNPSEIKILEK